MRTKKTMVLFLSTILLTILALMLCSCDMFGGGNGSKSSGSKSDSSETVTPDDAGWTTVENPNVYNALILGCSNVAYQGSKTAVTSNKGLLSVDSKFKVSVGDVSLWLTAKAKYKSDSPRENTIVSLELSTEETPSADSRIVSMYAYKDELYVALGNDDKNTSNGKSNKVKFSLQNLPWVNYFPFEMEKLTSVNIKNISAALVASVYTNKPVKAEYRHSKEGDEYRYSLDIDLDMTLTQLFAAFSRMGAEKDMEIIRQVKEFVAVFYGVEESAITDGNLPESSLVLNFQTLGNVISSMDFTFDIDLSGKTNLFSGGEMKGSAVIEKLSITNDYQSLKIPFTSETEEMNKYVAFSDTIFSVKVPLEEFKDGKSTPDKTLLTITTKVFQGSAERDFLFAEYSDATNNNLLKGIYVYNNIMYFYSSDESDEYRCIVSMDIQDAADLATRVVMNNLGGNSEFYPIKLFAYIINGFSADNSGIRFSIKPNFYTDVWYNFEDFCTYVNSFTSVEMMENEDILKFYNYVKTNEVIVSMGTHDPFFAVLSANDPDVASIISMLGDVSEETRLPANE